MTIRPLFALLAAVTALAACQPQGPGTTVTVAPDGSASAITSSTPSAVTVVPGSTTTITGTPTTGSL